MNANTEQSNPYAPPTAIVGDVADSVEMELAGRGTRLGAVLLDGIIFSIIVYVPALFVLGSGFLAELVTISTNPAAIVDLLPRLGVAAIVSLVGLIAFIAVTIIFVKRNGQTMGKKLLDIKVVRSNGEPAKLGRIFWMRNVIGWVISYIPLVGVFYGLVDALFIFAEKRKCIHDMIADTIVVKAGSEN